MNSVFGKYCPCSIRAQTRERSSTRSSFLSLVIHTFLSRHRNPNTNSTRGSAFVEFVVVLPLLVLFGFVSFRYSLLISTTPAVVAGLDALASSLPESSYRMTEGGILVDEDAVRRNLSHVEASNPLGVANGSLVLGLERQTHSLVFAAYRCRCGSLCSGEISRATLNSPDPALGNELQSACSEMFRTEVSNGVAGNDIDCARTPSQEHVCYGGAVKFAAGLSSASTESVSLERVNDTRWRNLEVVSG